MLKEFETIRAQLAELAPVINAFKSEAVQLRIVELVFARRHGSGKEDTAETEQGSAKGPKTRKRRAKPRKGPEDEVSKSGRKKGGATGPVVTLNELIEGSFFAQHRTLAGIVEHCRSNKAKNFRPDQLSGPLARCVRDDRLKREKNSDGQYEYWK